jgi:NAD(P)-dependent dehydrogenase (short-subunit alcohol dehydrogenase family)
MTDAGSAYLNRYRLDGRSALVTGSAQGIGLATARALAEAGARVTLTDIDASALERAAAEFRAAGHHVRSETLDVTQEAAAGAVVNRIVADWGRLDILVNNAGTAGRASSVFYERQVWERILAVNLTGCFFMAQAVARTMLPRKSGCIVNVASIMGLVGNSLYPNPAYHATKGALVNLTRALAIEWAPARIRVNAVAPCFVETPLTSKLLADSAMKEKIIERTPLGRLATADDVAAAILFLASDAAAMVTGHVLAVDGGWLAQ